MVGQTVSVLALSRTEEARLAELEAIVDKELGSFVRVGKALLEIRDHRLYRADFDTYEEYCQAKWGMTRQYANHLIGAAAVVLNLETIVSKLPENEGQARPLVNLPPDKQREVWQRAVDTAPDGKVTAAHVQRTIAQSGLDAGLKRCDQCGGLWAADLSFCPYCNMSPEARAHGAEQAKKIERLENKLGVHFSSDSPEWYTPPEIIERVVELFGKIDLDPCSNSHKSPNVPSAKRFTKGDDGLAKKWTGKVYMNPPYGREIVEWVEKLTAEHKAGNVTEAIALVPSRTDTEWFRMFRVFPRCFVSGRLNFSGHDHSAPFPSVVVYLGKRLSAFVKAFGDVGDVYVLAS